MGKAVRGVIGAVLAGSVLAGFATSAIADVKAGVDAWATGNYEAAIREWQGPAAAGDPDAQFNLAQAYKLGRGVPRDLTRAEALYASAAAKGHLQAGDNYGLLLFQRGERARAMPYVQAAAARGDARAQYILGLALFNGDGMPRDWVRAYALVSLAQQAGLPQASGALAQMDEHVSMSDRQRSVAVASQITAEAESTRARQVAAADLAPMPGAGGNAIRTNPTITAEYSALTDAAPAAPARVGRPIRTATDRAGSDAARAADVARDVGANRSGQPVKSATRTAAPASSGTATQRYVIPQTPTATGPWKLQLGAFGVPGNAQALWERVKGRPELAGRGKLLAPSGKLTRLLATGFASQADAAAACARLKSGGFTCLATRD